MLLSILKKLRLGDMKPTNITFHLVDRFLAYLKSVINDVLVNVNKFILPMDFVVVDMKEDHNIPLILR